MCNYLEENLVLPVCKDERHRNLFLKDGNKHLAGTEYSDHKYGFLVKNSRRFKKPIVIPGKLGFFNVELD
jgi:hypothetical protein